MKLSLTIYEPGHRQGNALGWHWEVLSDTECLDCGTCRTAAEATEAADIAWSRGENEREAAKAQAIADEEDQRQARCSTPSPREVLPRHMW